MPLLEDLYAKQRARQVELVPFYYSTQFTGSVVAAGATVAQNISIQADSHFVVRYHNITVYNSPNILVFAGLAALTLNLFDTGSGRTLQDNAQAIQNLCGGAGGTVGGAGGNLPFILPEPWLCRAGGVIQVTLGNLGTLTFPRVDFSLIGFKVFKFGATQPGEV
jgi:hypothetical protein